MMPARHLRWVCLFEETGQVLHFNISLSKQAFGLHYASVSRIVSPKFL